MNQPRFALPRQTTSFPLSLPRKGVHRVGREPLAGKKQALFPTVVRSLVDGLAEIVCFRELVDDVRLDHVADLLVGFVESATERGDMTRKGIKGKA